VFIATSVSPTATPLISKKMLKTACVSANGGKTNARAQIGREIWQARRSPVRSIIRPATNSPNTVPSGIARRQKPSCASLKSSACFMSGMRGIQLPRTADSRKKTPKMALIALLDGVIWERSPFWDGDGLAKYTFVAISNYTFVAIS